MWKDPSAFWSVIVYIQSVSKPCQASQPRLPKRTELLKLYWTIPLSYPILSCQSNTGMFNDSATSLSLSLHMDGVETNWSVLRWWFNPRERMLNRTDLFVTKSPKNMRHCDKTWWIISTCKDGWIYRCFIWTIKYEIANIYLYISIYLDI